MQLMHIKFSFIGFKMQMSFKKTVWTICDGEPLPIDGENIRLLRMFILSKELFKQGHDVTFWTSNYDHFHKKKRHETPLRIDSGHGFKIDLADCWTYKKNVSVNRAIHNIVVARSMEHRMRSEQKKPDVIVADMPTIELAELASRLGKEWGIPVVLSVRDLWPDVFHSMIPRPFQHIAPLLFMYYKNKVSKTLKSCSGIVGISQGYLDWALDLAKRKCGVNDAIIPLGYPLQDDITANDLTLAKKRLINKGVNFNSQLVSFIGTFGRSYDLQTVIKAAKKFGCEANIQFILCGDGEMAPVLKKEANHSNHVIFTGWLDRNEIACILSHSILGLAAYSKNAKQGLPNKFFEYMSYGLPIINSLAGEARDEIHTNEIGINYTSGDPEDLFIALKAALMDRDKISKMSMASIDRFNQMYHSSIVNGNYIDLIHRVLLTYERQNDCR